MKKFFCGNWKMNKTKTEAVSYFRGLKRLVAGSNNDIVVAVPFTLLETAKNACKNTKIKIAAQDIYHEQKGAFTGEISPGMIKEFADYVIIGHSERRTLFKETDELLNKKTIAASDSKLKVIFCIGETLEERKRNKTFEILKTQILNGLNGCKLKYIVVAYEPVWAIGTGIIPTEKEIVSTHTYIKDIIKKRFGTTVLVIYGGSVNENNAKEILKIKNVDGCLPGGASLELKKFAKIIASAGSAETL
jgi:triosephosphate isomerase